MSLQVWLPLNGTLDNLGLSDLSFKIVNYNNVITSATTGGKVVPGLYKRTTEETADYITSGKAITLNGDVSMCCWAKVTGVGYASSANGIFGQHGHLTGGLGITMKDVSSTDLRMSVNTGLYGDSGTSDRTFCTYYGSTNIYNEWHHLCLTYNSTTKELKMYVDGQIETITTNAAQAPRPNNTNYGTYVKLAGNNVTSRPIILFAWSTDHLGPNISPYRPPCELNDVRVYDHCLTKKEVKEIAKGLRLSYSGEKTSNLFNMTEYVKNTGNNMTITKYNDHGFKLTSTGSDPYVGTALGKGGSIGSLITFPVSGQKTYRISWVHISGKELNKNYLTYINSSNTAIETYTWYGNETLIKKGKRREYIFTPPEGTVKVHCRFGTEQLAPGEFTIIDQVSLVAYDPTLKKPVLRFNGTSDYINLGPTTLDMSNITFVARAKWDALQSWSRIWDFGVSTNGTQEDFLLANDGTSSTLKVAGRLQGGATMPDAEVGTIETNKWYHVAVVVKGLTVTTYISNDNKFKEQNKTFTLNGKFNSTNMVKFQNCYLGKSNWPDALFKGEIADFRIYASALTEEDIKSMYLAAQAIDRDGNEFVGKLDEEGGNSKISHYGEHNCNFLSETLELEDGSCWIQIQHHDNEAGTNMFTSNLDFSTNFVYNNDRCWAAFNLIMDNSIRPNDNEWEFLSIENIKNTDNIAIRRWGQRINPFNIPANEDGYNTSIANSTIMYQTNIDTSVHGVMRRSPGGAVFCITRKNESGHWFGAFGCWSNGYNSGVPTFLPDGDYSQGIFDLYMRIDPTKIKYREFKGGIIMPTSINEI